METKLFSKANLAFLLATLNKVMQNVEDEYTGASSAGRVGSITTVQGPSQIQSAVLKVYRVMYLTKIFET